MKPFDIEKSIIRLPFIDDWVEYRGKTQFAMVNYDESIRVGRPMIDICYCATRGFNGIVEKTVQWDKNKFKPSRLSNHWK